MELAMRRQSFLPSFMIERRPGDLAGDPGDPTFRQELSASLPRRFRAPGLSTRVIVPEIIAIMMPVAVMALVIMCRRDVIGDAGDRRRTRCNRLLAQSRKRPMAAALALPVRHRSFIPPITSRSVMTMVALGSGRGTDIGFEPRLVPKWRVADAAKDTAGSLQTA